MERTSLNLRKESDRLKTFCNWGCEFVNPRHLAESGFYYTGQQDIVGCVFCGIQIGGWERWDDPVKEHEIWSPNCHFVSDRERGNISMSDNLSLIHI